MRRTLGQMRSDLDQTWTERTFPIQPPRFPFTSVHISSSPICFFLCFFYLFIPYESPDLEVRKKGLWPGGTLTAEILPVDYNWCMEKCSRFGLESEFMNYLPDEQVFIMTQDSPPNTACSQGWYLLLSVLFMFPDSFTTYAPSKLFLVPWRIRRSCAHCAFSKWRNCGTSKLADTVILK